MAKAPVRADAARNKEKIASIARECFVEQGLEVSLDAVAKRAGVGPGTLYRHFPSREDLIAEVLTAELGDLEQVYASLRSADLGGEERLERWSVALRLWMTSYAGLPDPLRASLDAKAGPLGVKCSTVIAWTDALVDQARRDGAVQDFVTGRGFYRAVLGAAWAASASDDPREADADALGRFVRDGWRAAPGV
ncbi:TetR/AcrR family transcriptional regulator [Streptomyces sp. NPDC005790]|uniref:TetR/AcrR family transcriptional regulator n=1 Tax=Streptomyces sp. NPDC005790 TaxID=3154777 RepID=UPI0033E93968